MTETALTKTINVSPALHPDYIRLRGEIDSLVLHINSQVVDSPDAEARITRDANLGQKVKTSVTTFKKDFRAELDKISKGINADFDALISPLEAARETAKQKIAAYHEFLRQEQARIAEENRKRAEALAEEQALIDAENEYLASQQEVTVEGEIKGPSLMPDAEIPAFEKAPEVAAKVATDFGSSSEVKVGVWKLEDFSRVPDEYKKLDEVKINKLVKGGLRHIEGIAITEEYAVDLRASRSK